MVVEDAALTPAGRAAAPPNHAAARRAQTAVPVSTSRCSRAGLLARSSNTTIERRDSVVERRDSSPVGKLFLNCEKVGGWRGRLGCSDASLSRSSADPKTNQAWYLGRAFCSVEQPPLGLKQGVCLAKTHPPFVSRTSQTGRSAAPRVSRIPIEILANDRICAKYRTLGSESAAQYTSRIERNCVFSSYM